MDTWCTTMTEKICYLEYIFYRNKLCGYKSPLFLKVHIKMEKYERLDQLAWNITPNRMKNDPSVSFHKLFLIMEQILTDDMTMK